jgi:hypothetical protein
MAGRKTHDLAVVVREYQNNQGETKKQWMNIGARIEWDDGGASLLIDRHINLAGLPGEGAVRVSLFEPRPREGAEPAPATAQRQAAPRAAPASNNGAPFEDDIPFMYITGPW